MLRNFDLAQLRSFVAIADHRTFVAASREVARTQSALTQQIQRLEQSIGTQLFEKEGRYKSLTPFGENLLEYARHLIAVNDEAWRALGDKAISGSVRLGSPQDAADTILPRILATIARSFPRLQVEIHVDRSPFLMDSLRLGGLDLTLTTRSVLNGLEGTVLRTSPTVWICGAGYTHTPSATLPLIIADEPSLFRKLALDSLERAGLAWRTAYLAPHLIGIKAAIRAGLGITARSVEMLGSDMRVLGLQDGLPPLPDVNYNLLMRKDQRNPLALQVYDLIISAAGLRRSRST